MNVLSLEEMKKIQKVFVDTANDHELAGLFRRMSVYCVRVNRTLIIDYIRLLEEKPVIVKRILEWEG